MADVFERLADNMIELEGIEAVLKKEGHPVTNNLNKCRENIVENIGQVMNGDDGCDYCKNELGANLKNKKFEGHCAEAFLNTMGNSNDLEVNFTGSMYYPEWVAEILVELSFNVEINYCPMCGRSLKEENNE